MQLLCEQASNFIKNIKFHIFVQAGSHILGHTELELGRIVDFRSEVLKYPIEYRHNDVTIGVMD